MPRPKREPAKPRRIGRPTLLTEDRKERILQLIRAGNFIEIACGATGIDGATYYRWMEKGAIPEPEDGSDDGMGVYREFREAALRARQEAEAALAVIVRQAAPDDWKAASWLLERGHPDRWGRRVSLEGNPQRPVTIAPAGQRQEDEDDPERIAEIVRIVLQATGQEPVDVIDVVAREPERSDRPDGDRPAVPRLGTAPARQPVHPAPTDAEADVFPPPPA